MFVARRLAFIVVTLLVVSVIVFGVTEVLPGDVATMILGNMATEQSLAALRDHLGLDRPLYVRYADWLGSALRGDFGTSLRMQVPIGPLVLQRLGNSLALAAFAFVISIPLSILLGVISGLNKDKLLDRLIAVITLFGISLPEFVVGTLLIVLLATVWPLFPPTSMIEPSSNPFANLKFLVLPSLTLLVGLLAHTTRMTRANMIDVMQTDYVRAAMLKGLSQRQVVMGHALRNALLPTVTIIAMNVGWMIGGLVVVETVFSYPGLGQLMVFAITNRDVPLLQAVVLVVALIYAFANLAADILYTLLNPRIRY